MPRNPRPLALSALLIMAALTTILAQPQTAQATCYLTSRSILVTEDCTTPQTMTAWPADKAVSIMMEEGECCDGGGCPGGCTYGLTDLYMPETLKLYRYERSENQQRAWTLVETPIERMGQCHGFARYGFDTALPPGQYQIGNNNNAIAAFKVTSSQDIALRPVLERYQVTGGVLDGPCANGPLTITPLNDNHQTPARRGTGQNSASPVPTTTHGGCAGCAQPAKTPTSPWPWATLLGLGVFATLQRVQRRASERSKGLQEGVSSV